MVYSTIDSRPISLALTAGGNWLNWAKSNSVPIWETPFAAAEHLLACTPDAAFPSLQKANVPTRAMIAADCLLSFVGGEPISCMAVANDYPTPSTIR